MTKKITDDEKKIFREAMQDVKRIKSVERNEILPVLENKPPPAADKNTLEIKIKPVKRQRIQQFFTEEKILPLLPKEKDVEGETIINFSKTGLQHKRIAQLRQGKIRIEATLDLHQHTSEEAIYATDRFLQQSQQRGLRAVCIIHGKGHFSALGKPVIKNLLNNYLRNHPKVLAFHSAKMEHGGTGALYILIKSSN